MSLANALRTGAAIASIILFAREADKFWQQLLLVVIACIVFTAIRWIDYDDGRKAVRNRRAGV